VPQQTNHTIFQWDGSQYAFVDRIDASANTFQPNTRLKPTYTDEFTIGYQQQIGQTIGAGVRYIHRTWGNLIDDVWSFEGATAVRQVVNYDGAERTFRGLELTLDKRFSNNWHAAGSYTLSRAEGNHFADAFTTLGDFLDANCRLAGDTGVGAERRPPVPRRHRGQQVRAVGQRPSAQHQAGRRLFAADPARQPDGRRGVRHGVPRQLHPQPIGQRAEPGHRRVRSATRTYFYEPLGSNRLPGLFDALDTSLEATFRPYRTSQVGLKAEAFNVLNNEEKDNVGSTVWCESTATAACRTARENFGKATARNHFRTPRNFRITAIFRF
jgi:hypothetical protein